MGIQNSRSYHCPPNWKPVSPHLYLNEITKQTITHEQLPLSEQSQLKDYSSRLNILHPNIVQLIYYQVKRNTASICGCEAKKVDLFIEGGISKQIEVLKNECHCKEIVRGFKTLKKRFGAFQLSIDQIWMKEGKAKVWINENAYSSEKKMVDEEDMVKSLKKVLLQINCGKKHQINFQGSKFFEQFLREKKQTHRIQSFPTIFNYSSKTSINKKLSQQKFFKSPSFNNSQNFKTSSQNIHRNQNKSRNLINFSYEQSPQKGRTTTSSIPLAYIHLRDKQHSYEVPNLRQVYDLTKINKGVQSDRTRAADISLAKNSQNMGSKCTKVVQKKQNRQVIDEVAFESERNVGFSGDDNDEVMQAFELQNIKPNQKDKNEENLEQRIVYKIPEKTKTVVKKYLTEEDIEDSLGMKEKKSIKYVEKNDLVEQKLEIQEKQWSSDSKEISIVRHQVKETQSVFEEDEEENEFQNQSGLTKIQMFQENRESLKNELDVLFKLYQPEQVEEKTIKQKVEEKKATFADLKAEALKILGNSLF